MGSYSSIPVDKIDASGLISLHAGALPNWAGMIALFFGNAMALDFMERVFAAKSPQTARNGCYYAGVMTLIIGASATILGIASITSVPNAADPRMVLPTSGVSTLPYWMGMMVFIGVLGASMSTANGAMLVISVVSAGTFSSAIRKVEITDSKMLTLSRVFAIPTAAAAMVFAWVRPEPGILLVVAFRHRRLPGVWFLCLPASTGRRRTPGSHCLDRRRHRCAPHCALRDARRLVGSRHADSARLERHYILCSLPRPPAGAC